MISQKLRLAGLLLIVSIITTHCQINQDNVGLAEWVKINEENLYRDFLDHVLQDTQNIPQYRGLTRVYTTDDTTNYMGKLAQFVKTFSDGIEVRNIYTITNKADSPQLKILLTVDYDKKYAKALDSLLDGSIQMKLFTIEKYMQPDTEVDIFSFAEGQVNVENIRLEILNRKSPFDIIIYIKGKKNLLQTNAVTLHQSLLGEELLVKQVDSVRYEFVDSLAPHLLRVYEARSFLQKP